MCWIRILLEPITSWIFKNCLCSPYQIQLNILIEISESRKKFMKYNMNLHRTILGTEIIYRQKKFFAFTKHSAILCLFLICQKCEFYLFFPPLSSQIISTIWSNWSLDILWEINGLRTWLWAMFLNKTSAPHNKDSLINEHLKKIKDRNVALRTFRQLYTLPVTLEWDAYSLMDCCTVLRLSHCSLWGKLRP